MNQDQAREVYELLRQLKEFTEEDKIYSTFVPALQNKVIYKNNNRYLTGNFNLGGTVSGRLSSNSPNLQQLPSTGTRFAKPVKQCFVAPEGYWMVGADFSSLEDRISALQTKDPNKLKVYLPQKQFVLEIDGVPHRILGDTMVEYDGQIISGERLYEILNSRVS